MKFYKMHGAGNDFIFFDGKEFLPPEKIVELCDRNTGIGADGVIFIFNSPDTDFTMKYFNSDGSQADFCANGGRCAILLAKKLNYFEGNSTTFTADDGIHTATILDEKKIKLKMVSPIDFKENLTFDGIDNNFYFINSGVEHVVGFYDDIILLDIKSTGRKIRYDESFPKGTNVNFVKKVSEKELLIRTYERGVEAETKACGTGITAAALVDMNISGDRTERKIHTVSGDEFRVEDNNGSIFLTGPVKLVYEGIILE